MNSEQKDNTEKNLNELLPSNLVSEFECEMNEKPKEDSDFSNNEEGVDVNFFLNFFFRN